jgi:CubicO group peptidase (beta-lactamase class C family)
MSPQNLERQPSDQATNEGRDMARGLTGEGVAALDLALARHVDRGELPGLVALVARDDDVHAAAIGSKAFGDAEPIGRLPLLDQPGTRWRYNTGATVAGVLIERAAGAPLPEVLRERVFEPLGMADTGFWVPAAKRNRFTTFYAPGPDGELRVLDRPDPPCQPTDMPAPPYPAGSAGTAAPAPPGAPTRRPA